MPAKFSASEIASFFVQYAKDIGDETLDNLKLNKILFYAQGASLDRFGLPLFDDTIQAWDMGPVIPSVYHTYKVCGRKRIEEPPEPFDENRLSSAEVEMLIDVYEQYGRYTGLALKDMTHAPGTPWSSVYKEGVRNIEISQQDIKEYFKTREHVPEFRINPDSLRQADLL